MEDGERHRTLSSVNHLSASSTPSRSRRRAAPPCCWPCGCCREKAEVEEMRSCCWAPVQARGAARVGAKRRPRARPTWRRARPSPASSASHEEYPSWASPSSTASSAMATPFASPSRCKVYSLPCGETTTAGGLPRLLICSY